MKYTHPHQLKHLLIDREDICNKLYKFCRRKRNKKQKYYIILGIIVLCILFAFLTVFIVNEKTKEQDNEIAYTELIKEINDGSQKILTIEDQVEYQLAGVSQIQAKSEIGFDFTIKRDF